MTYVIKGELAHEDSTGGKGVIRAGELQHMSAGTGVVHSEMNPSSTDPVHLLQIWVMPAEHGVEPQYDQLLASTDDRKNVLLPVASGREMESVLPMHQDATIYISTMEPGASMTHPLEPGRRAYLFLIEGELDVGGTLIRSGDAALISQETEFPISAQEDSELLMLDLP